MRTDDDGERERERWDFPNNAPRPERGCEAAEAISDCCCCYCYTQCSVDIRKKGLAACCYKWVKGSVCTRFH